MITFLLFWTMLGFVIGLCVVADKGFNPSNWKQWTFFIFLCGPVAWSIGIFILICAGIYKIWLALE